MWRCSCGGSSPAGTGALLDFEQHANADRRSMHTVHTSSHALAGRFGCRRTDAGSSPASRSLPLLPLGALLAKRARLRGLLVDGGCASRVHGVCGCNARLTRDKCV